MQRTALGAAEVPEVNSSTHSVSTSGSSPGSPVPGAQRFRAASSGSPMVRGGSSSSANRSETSSPPGSASSPATGASSSW